jgi:hypothetical protein
LIRIAELNSDEKYSSVMLFSINSLTFNLRFLVSRIAELNSRQKYSFVMLFSINSLTFNLRF